jgi:hypothetical protein
LFEMLLPRQATSAIMNPPTPPLCRPTERHRSAVGAEKMWCQSCKEEYEEEDARTCEECYEEASEMEEELKHETDMMEKLALLVLF